MLRANEARARHSALNKADTGTRASDSHSTARAGGPPKLSIWRKIREPVTPTLTRFKTAVAMLKAMIVSSLPSTISLRSAGLLNKVSSVPRSFSPAHRSTAG